MIVEIAGSISLLAGLIVLFSNPERQINWIVASLFLSIAISHAAVIAGILEIPFFQAGPNAPYYPWRRANALSLAFCPSLFAFLHNSIVAEAQSKRIQYCTLIPWILSGFLLTLLCFSESFIFKDINYPYAKRGSAYFIYAASASCMYVFLVIRCYRSSLKLTGIHLIEMRLVAFNGALAALTVIIVTGIGNTLHLQPIRRSMFAIFPAAALISMWAMTSSKIYDIRQILIILAQRLIFAVLLTVSTIGIWFYYETKLVSPVDILLITGICGGTVLWLDRKSRDWFDIRGEKNLARTRRLTIELAQNETDPTKLAKKFEAFLAHSFYSEFAMFLFKRNDFYENESFVVHKKDTNYITLCEMGWATPENLIRRRSKSAIVHLRQFLDRHAVGLITVNPQGSHDPSLLMVLGRKKNPWPFTYPEIQRLQNIGELMDNILTHARLTTQAALTARVEHLAMMSRGLAHDLKNLITPVSSFLIHTDNHFSSGSPEAEVHSAARRSVRIMTDYVREALFFSERLAPNFEIADLSKLFQTVSEITASRAARRGITVSFAGEFRASLVADAVLLQRMLGNLVSNAIDASSRGQKVAVSISKTDSGKARFQVKDEGAGIAPEHLGRIFDPYFTTKEFGEDVRGFGLGLTICQKIAELHGGTISVHSQVQRGTTVSVDLPPAPSSVPRNEPVLGEGLSSLHPNLSR